MNILLLYPQYSSHSNYDSRSPSLSLLYLAANLEKAGHKVKIFDASMGPIVPKSNSYFYGLDNNQIVSNIKDHNPDIVGITCSFESRWPYTKNLAQLSKMLWPKAPVIIGGLYPTYAWKECLTDEPCVNAIALEESEESFLNFVNSYENLQSIPLACEKTPGFAWREEHNKTHFIKNDKTSFIENLDTLPYPAWHFLNLKKMFDCQKPFYNLKPPYFTILSSRGCPEACTFCNMYITHGRKWRGRSPSNFVDEIEHLQNTYNVNNYFIADDNFSFNLNRAKEICKEIINRKLKINYHTGNGLNIKRIDKDLLELMKKSGCITVALAIESGANTVRNEIYKKNLKKENIVQAVNWCKELKLPCVGFFMVGAPGETQDSINDSKELIKKLPLSLITCGIFTPYPGTKLYEVCQEKNYLIKKKDTNLEFASGHIETENFNLKTVLMWQKELYISFIKNHFFSLCKQLICPKGLINCSNLNILKRLFGFKIKTKKNKNLLKIKKYFLFFMSILKSHIFNKRIPLMVTLCVTNRCNLKCIYCYLTQHGLTYEDPSTQTLLNLIDELAAMGSKYISLNGGEALLRKDIDILVDRINGHGMISHMTSNGLLVPAKLDTVKKLDSLCISLDGLEEANDKNRGTGVYKKIIRSLETLNEHKIKYHVHTVLTQNNKNAIDEMLQLAKQYKFQLQFSALREEDSPAKNIHLDDEELKTYMKKIIDLKKQNAPIMFSKNAYEAFLNWPFNYDKLFISYDKKTYFKHISCSIQKLACHIEADGSVYPCIVLVGKRKVLNYINDGFQKAWDYIKDINCKACYNICSNDMNLFLGLNFKSSFNAFKIVIKRIFS